MTRHQFWLLNGVSALLIILLLAHSSLSRQNARLGAQINTERAYINNARQLQPFLENLARRINAAGESDIQLRALLTKYDIKVNPPPDAKAAEAPQKPSKK